VRWFAGRTLALGGDTRFARPAVGTVEVLPASLALFAISILGNSIFIYMSDRIREHRAGDSV
jgi:hypothetical protein